MTRRTNRTPRSVLVYGLFGIIPFWSLPLAGLLAQDWTGLAATVETAYAALILSFLGGARWGLALRSAAQDPGVIGLAMTPTLAALVILMFLDGEVPLQLLALATALSLSWTWDCSARGLPPWYGRLRSVLTIGAVGGLCVSILQWPQ